MIKSILTKSLQAITLGLALTASLTACVSSPTQESTGQYLDDSTITTKIKTKFLDDPMVSGLNINVETYKGVVQLSGFANSSAEITQAELLAEQTDGVRSVRNNIHMKN